MTTETSEFPLVWDDPTHAERTWRFDLAHSPDVMTPLGFDLYYGPFITGMGFVQVCVQNYYAFLCVATARPGTADAQAAIAGARRWQEEILPEVLSYDEHYRFTDFEAMPTAELISEIDRLPDARVRCGQLHTMAMSSYFYGMTHLIETYCELTEGDELSAVRLVQGHGNKSVEAGHALWRLSKLVTSNPAVRDRLLSIDSASAKEGLALLQEDSDAQPFLEALRAFLDEFGWRSNLFELADPTWVEDPTIPLSQLRAYMQMPEYDPFAEQKKLAEQREEALRKALAPLAPDAKERLLEAVEAARQVVPILEDHNYYIDQRVAMLPRRLVLAAGHRLVSEGRLAVAEDVFYLRGPELRGALLGNGDDARTLVEHHRREMERWSKVKPPAHIGAEPEAGEPVNRFVGAVGLRSERANELRGNAASAGVVRGPARVLLSLDEADKLKPGDVLVARTTMPPWTPLFAVACAVVTEVGGILIHAAVVAREYGIPAVLGVQGATTAIHDGQLLEVDGSKGIVRILN